MQEFRLRIIITKLSINRKIKKSIKSILESQLFRRRRLKKTKNKMDKIIETLIAINKEKKHTEKFDIVCSLGGIVSLLNEKINKIEKTRFNDIIKINELGFYKNYENGKLVRIRQVKLLKFCYIENEYIFQIGNENSKEKLIISENCYPLQKYDIYENIISKY